MQQVVKDDPQQTTCQLAGALRILQSTVDEHLRAFGFVSKLSKWVLQLLTETQHQGCVEAAVSLLAFRRSKIMLSINVRMSAKIESGVCKTIFSTNGHGAHPVKT